MSLNAVMSDEPAEVSPPVSLLIRSVLEEAVDFTEAVRRLRDEPIACDCLLLVTGIRAGEMVVIERTPRRAQVREAENGSILVTNHYRSLASNKYAPAESALQETSCGRLERASELIRARLPTGAAESFEILRDPQVQMGITAQPMVFCPATGLLEVRLPGAR